MPCWGGVMKRGVVFFQGQTVVLFVCYICVRVCLHVLFVGGCDFHISCSQLLLPLDTVIADQFDENANIQVAKGDFPDGWEGLDIGPESIKLFTAAIKDAKTILWNGPMGCFEMTRFSKGTNAICQAVADCDAVSIIGGGDSVSAVRRSGLFDKMTHVSTGGGASLEFLEGAELPGVAALDDK